MKKGLIAAMILLLGGFAASPWLTGILVEQELRSKVQQGVAPLEIPEFSDIKLMLEDYQRGYATSTATLHVDMEKDSSRYLLVITHAPLIKTGQDLARIRIVDEDKSWPEGDLRVNWKRQLLWTQTLPPQQNGKVFFQGGTIVISGAEKTFPRNMHWDATFNGGHDDTLTLLPWQFQLDVQDNKLSLSVDKIHAQFANKSEFILEKPQMTLGNITVGGKKTRANAKIHFAGARMTNPDGTADTVFHDSSVILGIAQEGESYDLLGHFDAHFTIDGKLKSRLAEQFPLIPDHLEAEVSLHNVSEDTIKALTVFIDSIDDTNNKPDLMVMGLGLRLYQDLLMRDLIAKYQLSMDSGDKNIHFGIQIAEHIKDKKTLDNLKMDNAKSIMSIFQGSTLTFRANKEWFTDNPNTSIIPLKFITGNPAIIADDKGYALDISIQDAHLLVNGQSHDAAEAQAFFNALTAFIRGDHNHDAQTQKN